MDYAKLETIPKTFSGAVRGQPWTIDAHLAPAIHLIEQVIEPGVPVEHPPFEEAANARKRRHFEDGVRRHEEVYGTQRYRHRALHRAPDGEAPGGFMTREHPRRIAGRMFSCQEWEWEFVLEHRDLVFQRCGMNGGTSVEDKVRALAEDVWRNHRAFDGRRIGPEYYPNTFGGDALALRAHCVGTSAAIVLLCATLEIPARQVGTMNHSMAEVFIDGRWWFVENAYASLLQDGGTAMVDRTYAQLSVHPMDPGVTHSARQRYEHWLKCDQSYIFCQPNGYTGGTCPAAGWIRAPLTPQTAQALYPGVEDLWYKSPYPDRYPLLWGKPGQRGFDELRIGPGEALARRFWIGKLSNTKAIQAQFHGSQPAGQPPVPADGGEWFVFVNDRQIPLSSRENAKPEIKKTEDGAQDWRFSLELPSGALKEDAYNMIGMANAGRNGTALWLRNTPNALIPPERCRGRVG
ncbi:MAG: transglutaminase domain-containing protein [Kiritimatiellae bacterium]|nr:transglutaminase domain-containing protein [Kiritimatiellia bacterium]